jgi:hypothetical protein
VDASNPNFQKYDDIWTATAEKGLGVRGGPNKAPTNYFYQAGFFTPFGPSWGAPFAPTASCAPAPSPSPSAGDSAAPSVGPSVASAANQTSAPKPKPSHRASPALLLAPLGLWGLIGKLRTRHGSRVTASRRRSKH